MSPIPASTMPSSWIEASRDFLSFLEADGEGSIHDLAERLAGLIAVAEATPLPSLDTDEEHEPDVHDEEYWGGHAVRRFPALAQLYPMPDDLYGLGAIDLAELALELEQSLVIADAGKPVLAQWEWRFGFDTHWGWAHAQPLLSYLKSL